MDIQLQWLQWIQQFKTPLLDVFFLAVTQTAEETFFILCAAFGLWCFNKKLAQRVGFIFITSTVLNPFLKSFFAVSRPIGAGGIESLRIHTAEGLSFPSGHTQSAASFWLGIWYFMRQPWVAVMCFSLVLLVAMSRLYLGLHWPVDVAAGIFIAMAWLLLVAKCLDYAEQKNNLMLLWWLVLPFFIPYFLYPENKPLVVSLGASVGYLAGLIVERRWLNYSVQAAWPVQCLKLVLGCVGVLLLKIGLKEILIFNAHYADLIRYLVIGLWLTAGAPWMFMTLGLSARLSKASPELDLVQ